MANEGQLRILKKGKIAWNAWRKRHRGLSIDLQQVDCGDINLEGSNLHGANFSGSTLRNANLSNANLRGANLSRTDLSGANLSKVVLSRANLTDVNFHGANFFSADLSLANLNGANLCKAKLVLANLHGAKLQDVNLRETNLNGANFHKADLSGANLSGASLALTNFKEMFVEKTQFSGIDLREVKGLGKVTHLGPSTIGLDTIRKSEGKLPIEFMRGCGLTDFEIVAAQLQNPGLLRNEFINLTYQLDELRNIGAIQFHSCFISYSSKDAQVAKWLYTDLQKSGVRCWFAPHDLKIGEKIRLGIDRAVSTHEKLLLILSKDSIESDWVEHEVEKALAKERKEKVAMLFPIRLDDAVMETPEGWADYVKNTRHIGDFSQWKNDGEYKKAFNRLKKDLRP